MLSEETRFQVQFIQIAIISRVYFAYGMTYVSIWDTKSYNTRHDKLALLHISRKFFTTKAREEASLNYS